MRSIRRGGKPTKGYYRSEHELVQKIKGSVTGKRSFAGAFKTVECQIMDVADDIAYSTYDLEDAFKAGFITPIDLLASTNTLLAEVARTVSERVKANVSGDKVRAVLLRIFGPLVADAEFERAIEAGEEITYEDLLDLVMRRYRASKGAAEGA